MSLLPSLVVSVTASHQSGPGSNPTATKNQLLIDIFWYYFIVFIVIVSFDDHITCYSTLYKKMDTLLLI